MFLRYFCLITIYCFSLLQLSAQKNRNDFSLEKVFPEQDTLVPKTTATHKVAKNEDSSKAEEAVEKAIQSYNAKGLKRPPFGTIRNQFEKALKLSEEAGRKDLQLQVLPYLKSLAESKNNTEDIQLYSQKMQALTAISKSVELPNVHVKHTVSEPIKTSANIPVETEKSTIIYQSTTTTTTEIPSPKEAATEKAKKQKEQLMLVDILKEHKAAIQSMNEAQAKNALLELHQKSLVDSFKYIKITDSLALINKDLEIKDNKTALEVQAAQKRLSWAIALFVALVAIGLFLRFRKEKKYNELLGEKNDIIAKEKERSEELLLNILPVAVADELKTKGLATARHYTDVTVLFTDFKGFTSIASQLSPQDLVADLDYCFRKFDEIVLKHGLEKIKTIGDSYMVASGIPETSPDHALRMVRAAKEMVACVNEWKTQKMNEKKPYFDMRIGVNSGPVVAGVVGSKKFAYDIWGDTVNIASRMESSGEAGRINVSASTYKLIKNEFICEYRGKVSAKNSGEVDMYFVN